MTRVRDVEGRPFLMKGGPYDGMVLRIFESDYDSWMDPNYLGRYVRPHDVDVTMKQTKRNKKGTNVPHMIWQP